MMNLPQLPFVFAIVVGAVACVCDLRTRRIPNILTFGAALAAMATLGLANGADGLLVSVQGWLLGVALFFPFFALGGLGGGDVKLMGALGAWLGPALTLHLGLYASLAGGAMAVVVALRASYLTQALRNVQLLGNIWLTTGLRPIESISLRGATTPRLAYAVPMFAGLLVTLWLQ